jgi:hypothetical protein
MPLICLDDNNNFEELLSEKNMKIIMFNFLALIYIHNSLKSSGKSN